MSSHTMLGCVKVRYVEFRGAVLVSCRQNCTCGTTGVFLCNRYINAIGSAMSCVVACHVVLFSPFFLALGVLVFDLFRGCQLATA